MELIDKAAVVAEIEKLRGKISDSSSYCNGWQHALRMLELSLDTLEVREANVSDISENLAEAYEYLDFTSTGNLAHNKPMVSARLKKAIRSLFDAGLFKLTHDKKYRMENLGLKAQKGEEV